MNQSKLLLTKEYLEMSGICDPAYIEAICYKWWLTQNDDFRLTRMGLLYLISTLGLDSYEFRTQGVVTGKKILAMCRYFKHPFYFENQTLVTLSSQDAAMISLCGSLEQYLDHLWSIGEHDGLQ